MKPTQGPWETDDDSQGIDGIGRVRMHRVVAPNGATVVEFSNSECNEIIYEDDGEGGGTHYDIEAMANANLIAAAPELYDALAWMVEHDETDSETGFYADGLKRAVAALAKARGEQSP